MSSKQPEAMRLADELEYLHGPHGIVKSHPAQLAAAELRRLHEVEQERDRLHALNAKLLELLKYARRELAYAGRQEAHDTVHDAITKSEGEPT